MSALVCPQFAPVDIILRRGGNINRSNYAAYEYLRQNEAELGVFYGQFGATLRHHAEGCYFLVGPDSIFDTELLKRSCLHLGLFILYKSRDESSTRTAHWLEIRALMNELESLVPADILRRAYTPKCRDISFKTKFSEAFEHAIATLEWLNFVEISNDTVRALEALRRFADPYKTQDADGDARRLRLLLQSGIVLDSEGDGDEN